MRGMAGQPVREGASRMAGLRRNPERPIRNKLGDKTRQLPVPGTAVGYFKEPPYRKQKPRNSISKGAAGPRCAFSHQNCHFDCKQIEYLGHS